MKDNAHIATRVIHAGQAPDPLTGSVTVPLYQTSTYAQEEIGVHKGYEYSRTKNPTRDAWENSIANLEGGHRGFAFASGMAAIDAVLRLLSSGDHVIAAQDMYGGTFRLFDKVLTRFGLTFTYVDMTNPENIKSAMTDNTKMVYVESPTNPMMMLTDIKEVSEIAHAHNCLLVVDNTFMTPYFQRPLELGADIVLHSATKYLGGHSDLVSGVVVTSTEKLSEDIHFIQNGSGGVCGPMDAWLCCRSVKTLAVRMQRHAENAAAIAEFCLKHPKVHAVHYPGLASHPQHELAKKQMDGFGGMISIELGSFDNANSFSTSTDVFTLAESLGGVESLICHPAGMTHGSIPPETRAELGITDGLVRLSVGIENQADLIADIEKALSFL